MKLAIENIDEKKYSIASFGHREHSKSGNCFSGNALVQEVLLKLKPFEIKKVRTPKTLNGIKIIANVFYCKFF